MPVLGKGRVMRNLLIEAQAGKPAPSQVHAQFFHQFAFAADDIQIADQQNAQQQFGINRGPTGITVAALQLLSQKLEVNVLIDQPKQMVLGNLILQAEVIEQCLRAVVLPHHNQQASEHGNQQQHRELWPAYSVNSAALQESTRRLFQQTQATPLTTSARFPPRQNLLQSRFFTRHLRLNRGACSHSSFDSWRIQLMLYS